MSLGTVAEGFAWDTKVFNPTLKHTGKASPVKQFVGWMINGEANFYKSIKA